MSGRDRPLVLEMRGICKAFPGVVALDRVDLTIEAGDVHMLLGENGAGKSTLMKILAGAHRKDAGEILLDGRTVEIGGPRDARALGIRVIYQELNLVPHLSVAENIFLGALPTRRWRSFPGLVDWRTLHDRTATLLLDLGMTLDPRAPVGRLGLAQRQLVEIAKALHPASAKASAGKGVDAKILVMDEPTSALTSREVGQLFALIERLASRGVSIVYITHRLDEVFRIGRRITVMRDGRHVATRPIDQVTVPELVRLMANRDLSEHFPKVRVERGAELLRVEGLGVSGVLTNISFSLHAGEVLGMSGLLGAGRTELARVIAGADRFDHGRLFVDGREMRFRSPADAIAQGIGLLPEDRKAQGLVPGLTVARNIALPHGTRLAPLGILSRRGESKMAAPICGELRVKATPTQAVRQLSGGNQQKVVLGKWLAGAGRIFIFDEPTRGVDVGAKVEIYNLMNRLTARGASIIMMSSELPELLGMSDRILVLHRGRIHAELAAADATEERVLSAALGLAKPALSDAVVPGAEG